MKELLMEIRPDAYEAFVAVRKRREYRDSMKRVDFSLATAKELKKTTQVCDCPTCEGKYYMVTWKGRNPQLWPNKDGSCLFHVSLHRTRIYLIRREKPKVDYIYKLMKMCLLTK